VVFLERVIPADRRRESRRSPCYSRRFTHRCLSRASFTGRAGAPVPGGLLHRDTCPSRRAGLRSTFLVALPITIREPCPLLGQTPVSETVRRCACPRCRDRGFIYPSRYVWRTRHAFCEGDRTFRSFFLRIKGKREEKNPVCHGYG
jgi:hypothetical protein